MKSSLYVSRCILPDTEAEEEVSRIVACARERNAENCVTGMLIFTGEHFAQLLEGAEESVDMIMESIRRDPRHHFLHEVAQQVSDRSFGAWSLGYRGQSTYVDRLVRSLSATGSNNDLRKAQAELRDLMLLLAHQTADTAPAPA